MKKKNFQKWLTKYVVPISFIPIAAGIFLGHFIGGMLTGAGAIATIFITIGKMQLRALKKKMDKQVRDYVINR